MKQFKDSLEKLQLLIGNTKLHKLSITGNNLYVKLEQQNFFGSIKDRSGQYMIEKAIENNEVNDETVIIESSSGNFGIALAGICKMLNLKFISVIDPNISCQKEKVLKLYCHDVIKVTERDSTGGYLLNRIKAVEYFLKNNKNSYNLNQYSNPNNYLSYYYTLGEEICNSFSRLDYAFISVSTGGTITGLSNRLKEHFPDICIVAVDVEGSLVFDQKPKARKLSGLGASIRTDIMDKSRIDEVVILSERQIIQGCRELLSVHNLFLGASSGAAFYAANNYLLKNNKKGVNAIFISPDAGGAYLDTVYNDIWVKQNIAG